MELKEYEDITQCLSGERVQYFLIIYLGRVL